MIVGERPTAGMRLRLVLRHPRDAAEPIRMFEGTATTSASQWELRATVDGGGDVTVQTTAPAQIAEYTRRVVRIAARHAREEGTPLPRMIQRWRADKT
jgi:hypothetical protein